MAEQSVTLQPGESKAVSFEVVPHEARAYQVSVDGLSGSFTALAPPPVGWEYSNGKGYYQSVSTPTEDYSRTVLEMDIRNPGAQAATKTVTLWWRVWGTVQGNWGQGESRQITIEAGQTYHYIGYFPISRNNWGWIVSVGAAVQQQLRTSDGGESPIISFPYTPASANLYGVVTDASTGVPLAGATITLDSQITQSDQNGAYTLVNLSSRSYHIKAELTGYTTWGADITLSAGDNRYDVQLAPIGLPPFTFINISVVGTSDYPRAGSWIVALFKATISNLNSMSVYHTLQIKVDAFDTYYNMYQWQNCPVGPAWTLTLTPGESYQFETDFWNATRQAYDFVTSPQMRVDFWLEDELGNKSDIVRL